MHHFDIRLTIVRPGCRDYTAAAIILAESVEAAKVVMKANLHTSVKYFFTGINQKSASEDLNQYEHQYEITELQGTSIIKFGWKLK